MLSQKVNHPSDKDFYIMELDGGYYVDGKFKGNVSRFINHSCEPNCELQRWMVKGHHRIAIVAIRDIEPNEPLSYDYQFDTNDTEAFKCYCGTPSCRGTMAPRKKEGKGPLTLSERRKLVTLARKKEQRKQKQTNTGKTSLIAAIEEKGELARCYTGRLLPGDPFNEVIKGPMRSMVTAGQQMRLLLKRNVVAGSDMLRRREMTERKALGKKGI